VTAVLVSPAAEDDLEDIWLAIAADNPRAATRILRLIAASIEGLGDHPRLGPRRADIRPHARMLVRGDISFSTRRVPTRTKVLSTPWKLSASSTAGATSQPYSNLVKEV